MKILVSGSSGLVGTALVRSLSESGHEVVRLVRSSPSAAGEKDVYWDPANERLDVEQLSGVEAVVHLAGDNIAAGRWNAEKKQRILDSRVKGTRLLAETLAKMDQPPSVMLCASAIGFYGDGGNEVLDEDSKGGDDFLANVCREWEAACEPAREKGIRVANLRFGMILSRSGGALAKMLTPFKMCVGGTVGSGSQYYSWVGLSDAVRAIEYVIENDKLQGPINIVSPRPVTNVDFTKTLGRVLKRPTVFPMPAFAARLAFGEMADALLLASTRVVPQRLIDAGFTFKHPELSDCLRTILK